MRRTLLLLPLVIAACAPAQRVYSTDPVGPKGEPLPLERVIAVRFEDGSQEEVGPGMKVEIQDARVVVGPRSWPTSQVEALHWKDAQGRLDRSVVATPDDLTEWEELPRLRRVELIDGEIMEIPEDAVSAFGPADLKLFVSAAALDREIPLDQIRSIELHHASVFDATVKSWGFWAGAGGAAILYWFVSSQNDPDAVADQ